MRTRDVIRAARKDGKRAGLNAASWVFDGNTSDDTYRTVLQGLEDGDPAVLNSFRTPDLSGKYAGDPTPRSLAYDYDVSEDDPRADWLLDEICTAWEDAASSAFWTEVERAAVEGAK